MIRLATEAVQRRSWFTVDMSEGSVSEIVGRALVSEPSRATDWNAWLVFWVDARCVPSAHADSKQVDFEWFLDAEAARDLRQTHAQNITPEATLSPSGIAGTSQTFR